MSALALLVAWAAVAGAEPDLEVPPAHSRLLPKAGREGDDTRCGACHTVNNWVEVVFPHDRTGFPLRGAHERTTCKACHPVDFAQRIPETCAGCHRDAHGGDLGTRCASCHDEKSWKSRFGPDAHRGTNFPLSGRHAIIPCESCHGALRDQGFVRPTVDCLGCHQADLMRTLTSPTNHALLNFSGPCRSCHDTWRWTGARYARHDDCFQISAGSHAGIACLTCHANLVAASPAVRCAQPAPVCTNCHDHSQSRTDSQHAQPPVPGYQYKDFKCYQCHRESNTP